MAGRIEKAAGKEGEKFLCYIDCREDASLAGDFLNLNIWGKAVYRHVLDMVMDSGAFDAVTVVTESAKVRRCLAETEGVSVQTEFVFPGQDAVICVISGRAVMVKSSTLRKACSAFCGGMMYSAVARERFRYTNPDKDKSFLHGHYSSPANAFVFYRIQDGGIRNAPVRGFQLDPGEAVVINTVNDMELAVVLKKKEESRRLLAESVLARIEEKKDILSSETSGPTVCLAGHSQLDFWTAGYLAGYRVKNCGIAGISSFEYAEYILSEEMLDCSADVFVVMHGTNDIVMDVTTEEAVRSILKTVRYIKERNSRAPVYFLSCMHINGRLDRDNRRIDELNARLKKEAGDSVRWIDTKFMDDEYGELDIRNTADGLHLSERGYQVLQECLETRLREDMDHEIQ